MDRNTWQERIRQRLQSSADLLRRMTPGMAYGAVSAATVLPLVTAAGSGELAAVGTLFSIVGGVGGSLIANELTAWKDRDEAELVQELATLASQQPAWRDALDALIVELETPRIVQAILSEADKDWFTRTLRGELERLGNLERYGDFFSTTYTATNTGSGTVVQGQGSAGAGAGGAAVVGHVHGGITINNQLIDPAAPTPDSLHTAYLSHLFDQLQALSLGGVDPSAASDAQVRLRLSAIYTALLTEQVESEGRMGSIMGGRSRRLSAVEQLDQHPRLVLMGDPGSGKSAFVNFVGLCLAGERLGKPEANLDLLRAPLPDPESKKADDSESQDPQPWAHGPLLPVRVVLRDFAARGLPSAGQPATGQHLWNFIADELAAAGLADYAPLLRKHLREEGGLLLFDGLDEVSEVDQRREQIKQAVEALLSLFPRCRALVTSRTYAYQRQDWRLDRFAEAVLAPFSPGQIARFVERWYAHIGPLRHWSTEVAAGRADLLKQAIANNERLHELAERPLLLTLMASLHAWRGGTLPERRELLYNDAVELLLDWWERQREVRDEQGHPVYQPSLAEWLKVDREAVRKLLNRLAYEAHASQPDLVGTADLAESALVNGLLTLNPNRDIRPLQLVAYLSDRAGLLVPRGNGVYTFPHRTFQEYLAACHLTDTDFPDRVAELARQDPNRWREVTLLAGAKAVRGAASTVWSLVEALCYQEATDPACTLADRWGAHLAGQLLVESASLDGVSRPNQAKLERVRRGLVDLLGRDDLPAVERAGAGRSLAHLGDPRPEVMHVEAMPFCYVPVGPFVMGSADDSETPQDWGKETPQHRLDLPYAFWMARYPVTNAHFRAFGEADGYGEERFWPEALAADRWRRGEVRVIDWDVRTGGYLGESWRSQPYDHGEPFNLANHPVVGVSWYEALAFARWLTVQGQRQGWLPPDWRVTLPSEAEWEKAARGGAQIPTQPLLRSLADVGQRPDSIRFMANPLPGRRFPWGDEDEGDEAGTERANYGETDINSTNTPGCFPVGASPYGVEELSGGVWEWTRSQWGEDWQKAAFAYPYNLEDGREALGAPDNTLRIIRGASWGHDLKYIRASARDWDFPWLRLDYVGSGGGGPHLSLSS